MINKIKKIKEASFGDGFIGCQMGDLKYQLAPLTRDCCQKSDLVLLLAKWRRDNQKWFPPQFKVTLAGTKKWLKERVIEDPLRLLFLIKVNKEFIGHIGFNRFNLSKKTSQVDNVIRGRPGFPGIMSCSIISLMKWGQQTLDLKRFKVETTSDNKKALKFYRKLGFVETLRIYRPEINLFRVIMTHPNEKI